MNQIEIKTAISIHPQRQKIFEITMANDFKFLALQFREFIRHFQPDQADQTDIFNSFQYFKSLKNANRPLIILMAYHEGKPVGYATSFITNDTLTTVFKNQSYVVLHEIFVDREYQQKSYRVGRRLFDATIIWAKGLGIKDVQVGFAVNNEKARDFYTNKLGFQIIGKFARKHF